MSKPWPGDDRCIICTEQRYSAHRQVDYKTLAIPPGPHRYVVVMTVGYRTDAVVLRRLLGHNYRCLGVLSSTTRVAELRRVLAEEGFDLEGAARANWPPIR